jgi:two-component system LytT family response regulator
MASASCGNWKAHAFPLLSLSPPTINSPCGRLICTPWITSSSHLTGSGFQLALSRARHRLQSDAMAESSLSLSKLLTSIKPATSAVKYLPVKSGSSIKLLKVEDIDWISSADNYVELHVGEATHLLRITMTDLARQLSKGRFARISRSLMVNVNRIQEIRGKSHGDFLVLLQTGTRLEGTRTHRRSLRDYMDECE